MKSMIVVKGPSGTGKGTRVVQFIEFLRTMFTPSEITYTDGAERSGKLKVKPLGLAFDELKLLFVGCYTTSNKSGLASWTSMDTLHASTGSGEVARDMLKSYADQGWTLVCEGEPLMLSDKWRPKFLFDYYGLDTLSLIYFHYVNREDYDARIVGRSGKKAGDSGWSRNEGYPKEFQKSVKEMINISGGHAYMDTKIDEKGECVMFGENLTRRTEISLLPHDADLACIGRAIMFQLQQQGKLSEIRQNVQTLSSGLEFEKFCEENPMLRSVDGPNPLAGRIGQPEEVPQKPERSKSLMSLMGR